MHSQCEVQLLQVHLLERHHFKESLGEDGGPDLVCCGRGREEHPPTGIKGKLVVNDNLPPAPLYNRSDTLIISMSTKTLEVALC